MKAARGRWFLAMRSAAVLLLSSVTGCGGGGSDPVVDPCTPLVSMAPQAVMEGTVDSGAYPWVAALVFRSSASGPWVTRCSGSLVAPDLVLTAAHCGAYYSGLPAGRVGVTFDTVLSASSQVVTGTFIAHPDFPLDKTRDFAVLRLDQPIGGITPATVAPPSLLQVLKDGGRLIGTHFETVGYGINAVTARDHSCGHVVDWTGSGTRRIASGAYISLSTTHLLLDMSAAQGDGGGCYGDSGGPHVFPGTAIVVSNTQGGDAWCLSTDDTIRVDTSVVQSFLGQYATLLQDIPMCQPGVGAVRVLVADVLAAMDAGATFGDCP
jgi:secreted trypsin-like serine protease